MKSAEENKQRCQYELAVEKYFGLNPDETNENTPIETDYGQLVNLLAMFDQQDRWVKVDKDNLPTVKVFACNKHEEYLVGHIHLHNGNIVCSADETVLYYVTHYQIPTRRNNYQKQPKKMRT